jgi:hypothetical protein
MEAAMSDHDGRTTTDHDTIRAWAEARGGRPARVADSGEGKDGGGILRIDFQDPDAGLEEIDWDTFFQIFEDRGLAFLHQDETAEGGTSRFNRFVSRD